ncbi:ectonucleotide pyrophosphatase phosphodiesterase [Branchiostoma belcheri]|nr:ectonucleotide pyrophosphatase phosphodiesterase [Branchiostoma belcheri]
MHIYSGSVGRIRPLRPDIDNTFDPVAVADSLTCSSPHMTVYNKRDLPKRFHFANNRRIEDVVISVEDKWLVARGAEDHYATERCAGGTHGYDNEYRSMHALFVAHGPAFKQNTESPPFQNIELYDLMADLVGVTPAPNNGTRGSLNHILRQPPPVPFSEPGLHISTRVVLHRNSATVEDFDRELDLTAAQESTYQSQHLPFGAPSVTFDTGYCHLTQKDYVAAYNRDTFMPLWSATTLSGDTQMSSGEVTSLCQRHDVRVPAGDSLNCTEFGDLDIGYLYSPYQKTGDESSWMSALVTSNMFEPPDAQFRRGFPALPLILSVKALLISNPGRCFVFLSSKPQTCREGHLLFYTEHQCRHIRLCPVRAKLTAPANDAGFRTAETISVHRGGFILWRPVEEKVSGWAGTYGGVNVISGPIFDWNLDGNRDERGTNNTQYLPNTPAPIPTHYYKIVTRCSDGGDITSACQGGKADVISFILPHRDRYLSVERGCQDSNSLMQTHVARVRDIELLTGLRFFLSLNTDQALQLRLFLPTQLWD